MREKKKILHMAKTYRRCMQNDNIHMKKQKKVGVACKHFSKCRQKKMIEKLACTSNNDEKNVCKGRCNIHQIEKEIACTIVDEIKPKSRKLYMKQPVHSPKERRKRRLTYTGPKSKIECAPPTPKPPKGR